MLGGGGRDEWETECLEDQSFAHVHPKILCIF